MYLEISKDKAQSLTKQIYSGVANKILTGEIVAHEKLPSTRRLAKELGVSRIIVVEVYEQLMSEGYIYSKQGAGSYISQGVQYSRREEVEDENAKESDQLYDLPKGYISFRTGVPSLEALPLARWGKLYSDVVRTVKMEHLDYHSPFGSYELRETLAKHLLKMRGVQAKAENIMITNGAAQAFNLLRFVVEKDQYVLLENPSSMGLRRTLISNGMQFKAIDVDENGLITENLPHEAPKLIFATPSHQFPTGVVLPLQRRIELINYARKHKAFIVEDDYDSEFRFEGLPIQSLQSLEPQRTIYVGTFSKTFSPAMRMGYMVLPDVLVEKMKEGKYGSDIHSPIFEQLTMARFIKEGHFEKYIRKMKKVYASRRRFICDRVNENFGEMVEIRGDVSGLHMVLTLHFEMDLEKLKEQLEKERLDVCLMQTYLVDDQYTIPMKEQGRLYKTQAVSFILGYGNVSKEDIIEGIWRLKRAVRSTLDAH